MFSPFNTAPLQEIPFNSRINRQYDSILNNNYYALGFNPGYALQASELNEIQELFFMNTNLTQRMNSNWSRFNKKIPFWEGLIPLDISQINIVNNGTSTNGTTSVTITFENGWYLWTDPSSRMSHWIYMNQDAENTTEKTFSLGGTATYFFGYVMNKKVITCCPDSPCSEEQDDTLRDNSSAAFVGQANTCGASRLKISFTNDSDDFESRTSVDLSSNFRPIIKIIKDSAGNVSAYFIDDQEILISTITE
jgi:hypothetical protein